MADCESCQNQLQPQWKLCPFCGTPPPPRCTCGENLRVGWKLCPFCGASCEATGATPTTSLPAKPAATTRTQATSPDPGLVADGDLSWHLRDLFLDAWTGPFEPVLVAIREASTMSELLTARDAGRIKSACEQGLAALGQFESRRELPPSFGRAMHHVVKDRTRWLRTLDDECRTLDQASQQVRALKLPDSTAASLIQGAVQANDAGTATGVGVIGGALLGGMLAPGIGHIIGGAVGAMVGQGEVDKKNGVVLDHYDQSAARLLGAVDLLFDALWDEVTDLVTEAGVRLLRSSHFAMANETWREVREQCLSELTPHKARLSRAKIEEFLGQWGVHQDALHSLIRLSLRPHNLPSSEVRHHARRQLEFYPRNATSHEDAADTELDLGDATEAIRIVERALSSYPGHVGLTLTQIEALAAAGHFEGARTVETTARQQGMDRSATLYLLRGLARNSQYEQAAALVNAWIQEDGKRTAILRWVRSDAVLEPLYLRGDLPSLSQDEELQGIVETHLEEDRHKRFLGLPAPPRGRTAQKEFLDLANGELPLFFFDWSVWGNAKTGFALTTRRVVWKCLWEDPVRISLAAISAEGVAVTGSLLKVGDRQVDMEDEALARAVATTIIEMASIYRDDAPATPAIPEHATRVCPRCQGPRRFGSTRCFRCEDVTPYGQCP